VRCPEGLLKSSFQSSTASDPNGNTERKMVVRQFHSLLINNRTTISSPLILIVVRLGLNVSTINRVSLEERRQLISTNNRQDPEHHR
jgi:hypothetical protein